MKLLRYGEKGAETPGLLDGAGRIRSLAGHVAEIDGALLSGGLDRLAALDPERLPLVEGSPRLGPPVARIGKIVCIGLNYSDHAAETGAAVPDEPILFLKATSAIIGPHDEVHLPPTSAKSDWEVELGVVIGREARYVAEADAMAHVAGYCVMNDISERAYQKERGGTWDKGKGCDTFGPVGPWLVTPDEAGDPGDLTLWLELNGARVQDGSTRSLIFGVPFLIHYISQFMSLQPGDIVSTGTPPGVGAGMKPPRFLKDGDEMRLGVEGLGEQRLRVRQRAR